MPLTFIQRPQMRAIAFMVLSTACFSLMNVFIRFVSADLHTTMIVFVRNFICIFLLLPILIQHKTGFSTLRIGDHFWRAAIGIIGMETWFYCVSILPLNQATALSYTAPLFTTLFAIFYLKEHSSKARWMALAIGFAGAMIILRPDPSSFDARAFIVLFATSMWAIAGMMVKSLTSTEPPLRIVFYMSVFMAALAAPAGLYHWNTPTLHQVGILCAIAASSIIAQWSLTKAYSLSEVSRLMPYDFGRLIFTALFAYIAFGEQSDVRAWIGAAVIIASAVFITRHEAKKEYLSPKTKSPL